MEGDHDLETDVEDDYVQETGDVEDDQESGVEAGGVDQVGAGVDV